MENKDTRILIVDDEQDLREILQFNLMSEGFDVEVAASAEEALQLPLEQYHLILLDVMMGGMSGYRMADIVRSERQLDVPIIFLTAKTAENDLLTGFNVGGDDYITKPFSIKEVVVRIKAIAKRGVKTYTAKEEEKNIDFGTLSMNLDKKEITIDGEEVRLTKKEFDILVLLLKNKDKFISRNDILSRIWTSDVIVTDRNVDVNIARMRKKIGNYAQNIIGRSGYGYCFVSNN
ncbi:MAG: response regulator transcription factor [Mangrovibacterium sp.]